MKPLDGRTCLVVAHRGASAAEPENTLAAFEAAIVAGADAIELDVRLTSDGVPVVLHDPDVGSATDGTGLVHQMTLAEIKRLDASRGRGPRQEVPTFSEALEVIGDRVGLDLEIKNTPGEPAFDSPREAVLEAALKELEKASFPGSMLLTSFNWMTIERSKEIAPDVATGFLTVAAIDAHAALVYTRRAGHDFVLPLTTALLEGGEAIIEEARKDGIRVGTWVADDEPTLETLFSWDVDAVASNDPLRAIAVRDRVAAQ